MIIQIMKMMIKRDFILKRIINQCCPMTIFPRGIRIQWDKTRINLYMEKL